ncbi:serine/threonine-protein kinase [Streptomyces sp. XD-27]|uniref:serine/threonine-protein kinase n=1 Tax=Streptomyces sp. XD-27 TaxID=3062779 RepID=UPI0026F43976|nr:serine/threonine-protein kinase [Streptomyces sp. XD-27]WKX71840.1 serine/threonine-protein kinase [Streptomyces sp. XD-27]
MPLSAGDPEVIGTYRLLDRLGSGGMGVVYLARSSSGRKVAVKVVHAQFTADDEFRTRFRQEVAAARRVSGAFTAPVVDADPDAERPWMATLYVSGPTLAERLTEGGPLDSAELRRLALGLAEALHDIHRVGVVHRDLKPANVLMAEDGPRVIDFGISRAGDNQALTMTGRVMGTPPFMSPEQLSRPRDVTAASDVFSLGALLVYAASGRGPFDADSPYMTAYQVVHEPPALETLAEPLRGIVAECLAKDPAARPKLPELMRRLRDLPEKGTPRVEGAAAVTAPTVTDYEPTTAGKRRRRTLLAAGAAALCLGIGGSAIAYYASGNDGVRTSNGPSTTARDMTMPQGWRSWQLPLPKAAGAKPTSWNASDLSPECKAAGTTLFCGGVELPVQRINALNGHVDWRAKDMVMTNPRDPDDPPMVSSAPFGVRGGLVYTHDAPSDSYHRVVALHADSGKVAWSRNVTTSDGSRLVGDLVLSTNPADSAVVARNAETGETVWTSPLRKGDLCELTAAGGVPYAGCSDAESEDTSSVLVRFDKRDGEQHRVVGLTEDEQLPLGSHDGDLLVLPLVENDLERNRTLIRIDPSTGSRRQVKLPEHTIGTGTLVGDRLFFVQPSGRVTLVDPGTGEEVWSTPTPVEQLGPPVVSPDSRTVYLGTASGRLLALDLRTGDQLWQSPALSASTGSGYGPPPVALTRNAVVGLTSTGTAFTVDPRNPDVEPSPALTTPAPKPSTSKSTSEPASGSKPRAGLSPLR